MATDGEAHLTFIVIDALKCLEQMTHNLAGRARFFFFFYRTQTSPKSLQNLNFVRRVYDRDKEGVCGSLARLLL